MGFNYTLPMGTAANTRLFKHKNTNIYSSVGLCNEETVCLIWSGPESLCNIYVKFLAASIYEPNIFSKYLAKFKISI
jgi:hypothetical protein